MNYRAFSDNVHKISDIVLGTDVYGTEFMPEDRAFDVIDRYIALGGNCLDTARVYAEWIDPSLLGRSEHVIGKYIAERKCRDKLVISTKCAHPPCRDMSISRVTPRDIISDAEESLRALKTDYIDILWLHRDSASAEVGEVMYTLDKLVREGKILSFGASNWTASRIKEANAISRENGLREFSGVQNRYSLADTSADYVGDATLVEINSSNEGEFAALGIPAFAFASQAKGVFSKLCRGNLADSDKANIRYYCKENLKKAARVSKIADKFGISPAQAALGYLVSNPEISVFPIVGCKSIAHLDDSIGSKDILLSKQIRNYLSLKTDNFD